MSLRMLNLGCGNCFHDDWTNVDSRALTPKLIQADVTKGIPFQDCHFDVVYHSHLLEHFTPDIAEAFLQECGRVLRPGGLLRLAVPDLEEIARLYLDRLEFVLAGDKNAEADYDWMMLELYDQTVRTSSGGGMKRFLAQPQIPNREFVASRMGWLRESTERKTSHGTQLSKKPSSWIRFLRLETYLERLKRVVLGGEYAALQEARFRRSGEIHAWMYDRYSLARLLRSVGFVDIRRCGAAESDISGWASYRLDVEENGAVRKPDSLFMECRKPE